MNDPGGTQVGTQRDTDGGDMGEGDRPDWPPFAALPSGGAYLVFERKLLPQTS